MSKDNLGEILVGASILVDYVLTVAVSVTAGIAAIISTHFPACRTRVLLCLLAVMLMTVANLRGLKESGTLFAPPTYTYVGVLFILIVACSFAPQRRPRSRPARRGCDR